MYYLFYWGKSKIVPFCMNLLSLTPFDHTFNPCTVCYTRENRKYLLPFCTTLSSLTISLMLLVSGIGIVFAKASTGYITSYFYLIQVNAFPLVHLFINQRMEVTVEPIPISVNWISHLAKVMEKLKKSVMENPVSAVRHFTKN